MSNKEISQRDKKLREMEYEMEDKLIGPGVDFEAGFEIVFSYLRDTDPDTRAVASKVLAYHRKAIEKLISIYQDHLDTDPRKAILAGRVLGRKLAGGRLGTIQAQSAAMRLGIPVSFITCNCAKCGQANIGIPCPAGGLFDYGSEGKADGFAYALPVLCDFCNKEFYVAWSYDPR
jgi:hypothetical protein